MSPTLPSIPGILRKISGTVERTKANPPAGEPLLEIFQVARRLRLSDETVRRMLRRRELTGYRVSQRWRVAPADLARFLANARSDAKNGTSDQRCNRCIAGGRQSSRRLGKQGGVP
jgi:excisionase family DNA binding protein